MQVFHPPASVPRRSRVKMVGCVLATHQSPARGTSFKVRGEHAPYQGHQLSILLIGAHGAADDVAIEIIDRHARVDDDLLRVDAAGAWAE